MLEKCKHTRNKFSHANDLKNCFNGTESAFYIYKLLLVIRLLLLEEINLDKYIEKIFKNYEISTINERIIKELKLEV